MELEGNSVDYLYKELWWKFKVSGVAENTRNGEAIAFPGPVTLTLHEPLNRVLFNPARDCNPFFHIAEVVWMLAGSDDVRFIEKFNKKYRNYAENDGVVYGAYGMRWSEHNQITKIINMLKADPTTRRAVLSMWDNTLDLHTPANDLPCNTHIYFRVYHGLLDMTVCNRSNDMVWGMLGTNVVVFTYLHELISLATGLPLGRYTVFTNNLHIYPNMPRYEEIKEGGLHNDVRQYELNRYPILWGGETWDQLQLDCKWAVYMACPEIVSPQARFTKKPITNWMKHVADPMLGAYLAGPGRIRDELIEKIHASDWKAAALAWRSRRL